jgi:hypothetical protein
MRELFGPGRQATAPATKSIPGGLGGGSTYYDYGGRGFVPGSPGTNFGALAGDFTHNETVAICLRWLETQAVSGPRICVGVMDDETGRYRENPDHELVETLKHPNPFQSNAVLIGNTIRDITYPGYSYWLIGDDGQGGREYYWVPTYSIEPVPAPTGAAYPLDGYWYTTPNTGLRSWLKTDQVLHFRHGSDPLCPWQGHSALAYLARAIAGMNAGMAWNVGVLSNSHGGTIISPADANSGIGFDEAMANQIRRRMREQASGGGAGGIAAITVPIELARLGFSPEEMRADVILDRLEEMILAACGLNATAVGLPSSRDTRTFTNVRESKYQAAEFGLVPRFHVIAEALQSQELPYFERVPVISEVWPDFSEYAPMQEDADVRATRAVALFDGDIATLNEARDTAGLKPLPETDPRGDQFKSEIGMAQAQQLIAASEPAPEAAVEGEGEDAEGDEPPELTATEDESEAADAA